MLSAFFPEEKRAQIIGLWKAAIPLGIGLGMVIGGSIAELWGWRHAFGLVAIPGFLLSIIFFFIKDYKTVELVKSKWTSTAAQESAPDKIKMKFGEIVKEFIETPSLIFTYLGFAGNAFVTTALLTWLPTYFHRTDGLPMGKAGLKAGAIMVMAIIGAPSADSLPIGGEKNRSTQGYTSPHSHLSLPGYSFLGDLSFSREQPNIYFSC
jgi:MFS family permease